MSLRASAFGTAIAALIAIPVLQLAAQTVDNQITQALLKTFPEITKGYIDLNGNGKPDQNDEVDEIIPPSNAKDSLLRAKGILDFILRNATLVSSARLSDVATALRNPQGAIPELISLQYLQRVELALQKRQEIEAGGLFLTPSARREAMAKMEGLANALLAAYDDEGKSSEAAFAKARDELFSMIGAGYPLPDAMSPDNAALLADMMINVVVRDSRKDSPTVKLAIKSLGKLRDPRAVAYLSDMVKVDAVRRESIQALGEIGDKTCLPVLLGELEAETDDQLRIEIIRAIGAVGQKDAVPKIAAFLKPAKGTVRPEMQRAALEALARISEKTAPDYAVQEVFRSGLSSADPQVRILALRGIAGARNNPQAGDRILELLRKEPLDEVKIEAIAGLKRLQLPTTAQNLAGILRDPGASDEVKQAAIEAIGESAGAEQAVGAIADALSSANKRLRAAAAEALVKLHASIPQQVIANLGRVAATRAADEGALSAATGVLARLADDTSLPVLVPLLANPSAEVKRNVTWALYRIRPTQNPRAVEELKRIVKSETEALPVRTNAVRALGAMRTDSAQLKVWETLATALKIRGDKYAALRAYAVEALGELGNPAPEVLDALCRTADRDQDPLMVLGAVRSLKLLAVQDGQVETVLVRTFRRNKDMEIRTRVVEALGDLRSPAAADLAPEILKVDTELPVKKRVLYALTQIGGERELGLVLDSVKDSRVRDYAQGLLEESNPAVLAAMVKNRASQSNKDVGDVLDAIAARLEEK